MCSCITTFAALQMSGKVSGITGGGGVGFMWRLAYAFRLRNHIGRIEIVINYASFRTTWPLNVYAKSAVVRSSRAPCLSSIYIYIYSYSRPDINHHQLVGVWKESYIKEKPLATFRSSPFAQEKDEPFAGVNWWLRRKRSPPPDIYIYIRFK